MVLGDDLFMLTSIAHSTSTRGHIYKLFPHCRSTLFMSEQQMQGTAYLQSHIMILVVSPGLLVLLKAQIYLDLYCLDANPSCA